LGKNNAMIIVIVTIQVLFEKNVEASILKKEYK
jgi:hypothetical protein